MNVGFLDFYGGVMTLRGERAALVAGNIANADTPNYKAVDVPFEAALQAQLTGAQAAPGADPSTAPQFRAAATVGLDGNDVSLDQERIEAARNGEQMVGAATFLHQATSDLIAALRPNPSGN